MNIPTYYKDQQSSKNWAFLNLAKKPALAFLFAASLGVTQATPFVEIVNYSGNADIKAGQVTLKWSTAAEIENDSFYLLRSVDQNVWVNLTTIKGDGDSHELKEYSFVDANPLKGTSYYKLEWRSVNGVANSNTIQITFGKAVETGGSFDDTKASASHVDLAAFKGDFNKAQGQVDLKWITTAELDNERFIVYRSKDQFIWQEVDRVAGAMNSSSNVLYEMQDGEFYDKTTYYKLEWAEGADLVYAITQVEIDQSAIAPNVHGDSKHASLSTMTIDPVTTGRGMKIRWSTHEETDNAYFILYRSSDQKDWNRISSVPGAGNSGKERFYSHIDTDVEPGTVYYKLEWVDSYGNVSEQIKSAVVPNSLNTYRSYPNPTSGVVRITAEKANFDKINKVRVISADGHRYKVGAKDINGQLEVDLTDLPDGIYIVELKDGFSRVHKN